MADAFVAKWLPKKHNLVIATFAGYVATYGLIKIAMGNPKPQKVKKEKVAKVEVAPVTSGYQQPTAENIGQWLENPANITAWEKSLQ